MEKDGHHVQDEEEEREREKSVALGSDAAAAVTRLAVRGQVHKKEGQDRVRHFGSTGGEGERVADYTRRAGAHF